MRIYNPTTEHASPTQQAEQTAAQSPVEAASEGCAPFGTLQPTKD